jgi:hypothetical protein
MITTSIETKRSFHRIMVVDEQEFFNQWRHKTHQDIGNLEITVTGLAFYGEVSNFDGTEIMSIQRLKRPINVREIVIFAGGAIIISIALVIIGLLLGITVNNPLVAYGLPLIVGMSGVLGVTTSSTNQYHRVQWLCIVYRDQTYRPLTVYVSPYRTWIREHRETVMRLGNALTSVMTH